ncbi:hypothetical protein [Micromonospora rosaria]|uniref:hypothetical protein n=1 Tax=Micromonospora rosaria TaxID=47874 RepID=UPI0012F7E245|nr:hypothetical protein [Micromonospora rosaria]
MIPTAAHPVNLAALIATSRAALRMTQAEFASLVSPAGRAVSRQRIAALERGQPAPELLLRHIAEACASMTGLDERTRDQWLDVLRGPEAIAPVPPPTVAERRSRLRNLAENVEGNHRWPRYRELSLQAGMDLDINVMDARRRLALVSDPTHWVADPADRVVVEGSDSVLDLTIDHGQLFALPVVLSNVGSVSWRDRLLVRLGPPVSSSLAFTPPVLSVPDTAPGESCLIAIPGRGPWFPCLTAVTYVMTFPDCRPAIGGGLQLFIDAKEEHTATSHPLPTEVAVRLRRNRPISS